jgi:hypothetical protein
MPVSGVSVRGGLNDPSGVGATLGGGVGPVRQHELGGAALSEGVAVAPRPGVGCPVKVGAVVDAGCVEIGAGVGLGVVLPHATASTATSAMSDERNFFSVSSELASKRANRLAAPSGEQGSHGTLSDRCRLSP